MPTYDYVCHPCKNTFERMHPMSDEPTAVCPECGKTTTERLIGSGGGVIFKGEGFHCNDYRDKKQTEEWNTPQLRRERKNKS